MNDFGIGCPVLLRSELTQSGSFFLIPRAEEQRLVKSATKASEPAFKKVWDNPEDADYDRL